MYNEVDADMRDDDDMRAELHKRVAELKEKLLDICQNKNAEGQVERKKKRDKEKRNKKKKKSKAKLEKKGTKKREKKWPVCFLAFHFLSFSNFFFSQSEMSRLKKNHWLETHLALVANVFIGLAQVVQWMIRITGVAAHLRQRVFFFLLLLSSSFFFFLFLLSFFFFFFILFV